MRKYIFILGIILTTITIPAYGYRSKDSDNVWTDPSRTTLAKEICSDNCAENSCWLPSGTYYDNVGTFTEDCGGGSFLSCPSGQYNIGVGSCVGPTTNGTSYGFWDFGGSKSNTDLYDLKEPGTWGVTFPYGVVKGIASCNETSGTKNVATDAEFDQSSTGKYCWCKMTSPVASRWVSDADYGDAGACASKCTQDCSSRIRLSPNLRPGVYGSVAQESFFDQTYARGLVDCSVSCSDGYYFSGSSCVYCAPASFNGTQTENITGGSRSRSKSCTSVNTSGGTSCNCSSYNYGGWSYSCASGAHQSGEQCVCDSGYYVSGSSCKYCDKSSFNVARVESEVEGCTTYSRDKNCTGVNVGTSSCSCSGYSYGDWYVSDPGCNIGGRCVSLLENGTSHTSSGDTWSVTFSYGTLSGISKCEQLGSYQDWTCYCKLTSPVTSGWWMAYSLSSTCLSDCSEKCASYTQWLDSRRQEMCNAL